MSKSNTFSPLANLTSLPGAQALDESDSIGDPGADGQAPTAEVLIAARPASPAPLAWVTVPDVSADIDAVPSPALQDGADSLRVWGLPSLAVTGPSAAPLQPRSGPQPLSSTTDPIFGAAVLDPFGLSNVGGSAAPAFADIDGDDDLDVFVGNINGVIQFFRNTGSAAAPAFAAEGSSFGLAYSGNFATPTLGDIDADGDLDAFVGNVDGNTQFFRNTGSAAAPAFTAEGSNFGLTNVGSYAAPRLADIDGDGDLDAFVGEATATTLFFRNTGNAGAPAFVLEVGNFGLTDLGSYSKPDLVDIDGDGDLDAFVGYSNGSTLFYRNTGSAGAPALVLEGNNFGLSNVGSSAAPTFADVDGDGDLDALVGARDGSMRFFVNNAPGVVVTPSGGSSAVTEGGATDSYTVVLRAQPAANVTITLDTTNAQLNGSANTLVFTPSNWDQTQTVVLTAYDDAVGEGGHRGVIRHTVSSTDAAYHGVAMPPLQVAIGDDDLAQGDPGFRPPVNNAFGLADVGTYAAPTFADIDSDGDLDAFVGNSDGNTLFFRNTGSAGTPAFAAEGGNFGLTAVSGGYAAPTFADIDGDGDLDAFVGSNSGGTQFFRNTGSAAAPAFTAEGGNFGLTGVGSFNNPAFADIDADGDLDAFIGNAAGNTKFFRNTGNAAAPAFTAEGGNLGLPDIGTSANPTFADLDGDGDLDVLFGEAAGEMQFFRNTGSANAPAFTAEGSNLFGLTNVGSFVSPTLADIDADGDLDVLAGAADGIVRFFVNNNAFVLNPPSTIQYTDTAFDDSFASVSRTLSTRGTDSAGLSWGINGGTNNGSTVSKTSAYGVLTVTKASGAYSFVPDDAGIEALGTNLSVAFQVTVSNGMRTEGRTLTVSLVQSGSTETAGNDTLTGTTGANRIAGLGGNDSLSGGDGNDSLSGMNGLDTLTGGNGNDLLDGGAGNDSMTGGAGNDRYVVQLSGDKVNEASASGTDSVSSSVSYKLPSYVEMLTLTGTLAINGTGNTSNNTVTGNSAVNNLGGGDGNDSLYGKEGVDTLTGGNGNDLLDGGSGNDSMNGGAGNDRYVVQLSGDKVNEASASGTDSVSSSVTYKLPSYVEKLTLTGAAAINGTGNSSNNTLTGNGAINKLSGGDGNDSLSGGSGNDVLDGGGGNDNLTGGAGLDKFRFSSALNGSSNVDKLIDFSVVDDRLELENAVFIKLTTTGQLTSTSFRANLNGTAVDANDYIVYETDTGKLFYDADGNGSGAPVQFATLTGAPVINSLDIFVT